MYCMENVWFGSTFYINRENQDNEIIKRIKAGWQALHNYEVYTTNKLTNKGHQRMYPSSNDIWGRYLDINNTNGKYIFCSTTQHGTKRTRHNLQTPRN